MKEAERSQGQTAIVAQEPDRHDIDIAVLQGMYLNGQGTLHEKIAKETGKRLEAGVGFSLANKLAK